MNSSNNNASNNSLRSVQQSGRQMKVSMKVPSSGIRGGALVALLSLSVFFWCLMVLDDIATGYHLSQLTQMVSVDLESKRPIKDLLTESKFSDLFDPENPQSKEILRLAAAFESFEQAPVETTIAVRETSSISGLRGFQELNDSLREITTRQNNSELVAKLAELDQERAQIVKDITSLSDRSRKLFVLGDVPETEFAQAEPVSEEAPVVAGEEYEDGAEQQNVDQESAARSVSDDESNTVADTEEEEIVPTFYEQGLLAGLPILLGVPDDIKEEKVLAQLLRPEWLRSGSAKTKLPTAEAMKQITGFRDAGSELHEQLEANSAALAGLQSAYDELADELVELLKNGKPALYRLLVESGVSAANRNALDRYRQFRSYGEKVGLSL